MVHEFRKQGSFFGNEKADDSDEFSPSDVLENSLCSSVDAEENDLNGFDQPGVDPKRIKLTVSNEEEVGNLQKVSEKPSLSYRPLGLTLPKTQSFLDLLEEKLSQGRKNSPTETNETKKSKSKSRTNDSVTQSMAEKLKASNFSASFIKIGTWELVSAYEGDLVAKCYFAKRKLVWEVLDHGLKSKIEIPWSDISAIRAVFPVDQRGVLDVELSNAPLFFREMSPQPRKHTVWHSTTDFTGGQAITFRRHHLEFPEGTFEKHYEKLLHSDNRLLALSQRPFPTPLNSPYFPPNNLLRRYQNFSFKFNGHQPELDPRMQYPPSGVEAPTLSPFHQVRAFQPTIRSQIAATNPNSSLSSVMEFPHMGGNVGNRGMEEHRGNLFRAAEGMRNDLNVHTTMGGNHVQELPSFASANQVGPFLPQRGYSQMLPSGGGGQGGFHSNNSALNEIANHLLNDSNASVFPHEQSLLAKVNSMHSLLEGSKETVNTEYSNNFNFNANNSMSTNPLNGGGEIFSQQSVDWSQFQGSNENFSMNPHTQLPFDPNLDGFGGPMG